MHTAHRGQQCPKYFKMGKIESTLAPNKGWLWSRHLSTHQVLVQLILNGSAWGGFLQEICYWFQLGFPASIAQTITAFSRLWWVLLSHCIMGPEGEGVLLAHVLWVCSPLDDPDWNFISPSKAPCRQKGEIALCSVPLLHPNMVSASREQWLKKDFKNRHYLSSGRAIKRNTSQVVSVNTITLQIRGKKSR